MKLYGDVSTRATPTTGHRLPAHIPHSEPVYDVFRQSTVRTALRLADELRKQFRGSTSHPRNNFMSPALFCHGGPRSYPNASAPTYCPFGKVQKFTLAVTGD